MSVDILTKPERKFIAKDLVVDSWESIEKYFDDLKKRTLTSKVDLKQWFIDLSELNSLLEEDMAWRYIKMTCDTANEELSNSFNFFVSEIQPKIEVEDNILNKKALDCSYISELAFESGYDIMIRNMKTQVELFREENIPLNVELSTLAQEYGMINGAMTIQHDDQELTLQQASKYLKSTDRELRKSVYLKVAERRNQDAEKLDGLFNKLIKLRHQVALNAGFDNYRDYKFKELGRFDYTPQDCFNFHNSIQKLVVPILKEQSIERKDKLNLDALRPWDGAVDADGLDPLQPFETGEELLEKSIQIFHKIDTYFGERLEIMKKMGHLDLVSRKGKSPGGYNYPLDEIGVPFIFMNAASQLRDVVTMIHEGGHAVHSFLVRDKELSAFKHPPSEVAELASMSMELITMEDWDLFFSNPNELVRAKKEHLDQVIETLPWVAIIDKFQHWIYTNPEHTNEDRKSQWNEILSNFSSEITDWSGFEQYRDYMWQKQLHLFEVPFYYIEYAMAQLGAIAVYKNYCENKNSAISSYKKALSLGYTKSIVEVYEAADIKFDFSEPYISELIGFIQSKLKDLKS